MNEFLEQFLLESRELVEQATADLLAMEKSPADKDRLDGAFRAFHTLKGGAGIVDFEVMARAMHAAEEALSDARSGKRSITPVLIGDCLAALDQVVQWMDAVEGRGDLLKPGEADAGPIVARFARSADEPAAAAPADPHWAQTMLTAHPGFRDRARTAIRYTPDAECFFQGVDPLA